MNILKTYKYKGVLIHHLEEGVRTAAYAGTFNWLVCSTETLENGRQIVRNHYFHTKSMAIDWIDSFYIVTTKDSINC